MLVILVVCLVFVQTTSVTGGDVNAHQQMYPGAMYPMMQREGLGHYQRYVPLPPSQPVWENMRMPMPFCNVPSHQNMHMMRSPFINEDQWTGIPFQGQWKQGQYPNEMQGQFPNGMQVQWNQPAFKDQWRQTGIPNKGQGQMWGSSFQTKGSNQMNKAFNENQSKGNTNWKQSGFNNNQAQWEQKTFVNKARDPWQQATNWNLDPNVKMVGQWDSFPADDKMIRQPAVSNLIKERRASQLDTLKLGQPGSQTFDFEKLDAPVQSRRLR